MPCHVTLRFANRFRGFRAFIYCNSLLLWGREPFCRWLSLELRSRPFRYAVHFRHELDFVPIKPFNPLRYGDRKFLFELWLRCEVANDFLIRVCGPKLAEFPFLHDASEESEQTFYTSVVYVCDKLILTSLPPAAKETRSDCPCPDGCALRGNVQCIAATLAAAKILQTGSASTDILL